MISLSGTVEQIARHSRQAGRQDESIAADFGRLLKGEDQPLSLEDAGFGKDGDAPFRRESLSSVLDRLMPAPERPGKTEAKLDASDESAVLPMPSVPATEPQEPEGGALPGADLPAMPEPTPEASEAEGAPNDSSDTAVHTAANVEPGGEIAPASDEGAARTVPPVAESAAGTAAPHAAAPRIESTAVPAGNDIRPKEAALAPSRGETLAPADAEGADSRVLASAADDAETAALPKDVRREPVAVPLQPEGRVERKPPAGPEAAQRVNAPVAELRDGEAGAGDGDAPADNGGQKGRGAEFAQRMAGPVTVSASQAGPAAAPQLAPAAMVAASMEADAALLASMRDVAAIRSDAAATQATHTLKIQLQPADLGMVNARLSIVGDAMTVALEVETDEAHRRLQADSEQIVKALRGLGFEVETVTIQQVAPHAAPTPAQNAASDALAGRNGGAFNSDRQEGSHREGAGQARDQGSGQRGENRAPADRSGIYI